VVDARLSRRSKFYFYLLFLEGISVPTNQGELKTWRIATLVMVTLAIAVFLVQRFVVQFFDVVFEVCIFYIPTFTIVGLLLYFRTKSK